MYYNNSKFPKIIKACTLLVFMICTLTAVRAQNQKAIDSLTREAAGAKGKEKVTYLLSLCIQYSDNNKRTSYRYAEEAQKLAYSIGDSAQYVRAGRIRGQLLRLMSNVDSSLLILSQVLPTAERNKFMDDYTRILNSMAVGYTFKANYDEALRYNFKSLEIREAQGNKADISITDNNIGYVYYKLDDYERALEYYNKALALKREVNDKYDLDLLLINIGTCYNHLKRYKEASRSINEGFTVCGGNCSKQITMLGKLGLGVASFETGNVDEALTELNDALTLAKELKDVRIQLECLLSIARVHIRSKDDVEAEKSLHEAEALTGNTGYSQVQIDLFREFFIIYNQRKNFEKASAYQQKYIQLKDSVFSKELMKNLATIQTKFEERANLKTIKETNATLALKEETLKRQEAESLFYIVVSVLVFVLAALMFLLFRMTQRANNMLEMRVEKRTRELNDSNEALAKVNGELDNFIYKTSHDIRGPLASLKGICNVAIMDVHDEAALAYLQKLDFTAEKLNRILTRLLIINQINHAVLASNIIVFEELLEEILFLERKKGVPKRLKIFYEIEKGFVLKSDKEMLRIVLENLIDNGIKFYSESDRVDPFVKIFVYSVEGQVVIKVIDNGVGINAETKEKIFQMFVRASERSETGGIGLYLSRLATGRLEGKIEFRTTPEKYTEFSVKLPMDLAPILDARVEQERIREFEKVSRQEKQNRYSEL